MVNISEFVVEPRTRESMFEIVKMTHVCQYWRSTLISYPRLWPSIFVGNGRSLNFAAACLERSREGPLTVHLDWGHGNDEHYPNCTCIWDEWEEMYINKRNTCRYHTTIHPPLETNHTRRIRTLDVQLTMLDDVAKQGPDQLFEDTLGYFELFTSPLPTLESLSFHVDYPYKLGVENYLELPEDFFCWESSPPTRLRHLALHGCYGGPIWAIRNLTSFELAGGGNALDLFIELDELTFFSFIPHNRSLVSLSLSHCNFADRAQLSQAGVTPITLPELKSLQLMNTYGLSGFPSLVDVPTFKSFSSLRILVQRGDFIISDTDTLIHTENDDGFQLSYGPSENAEVASDWVVAVYGADPSLASIRFEGREPGLMVEDGMMAVPLSFFMKAKVLEIGYSFARLGYPDFWKDLEQVGPQLTTLHLEIIEWMSPAIVQWVEKFVKARFDRSMPLAKLERMRFGGMSEMDEEKAEKLWEEFGGGLDIDQYLSPQ